MAKPTSKKPAKKTVKGAGGKAKKSKTETYKIYIYKVLKRCTPTPASPPRPCPS